MAWINTTPKKNQETKPKATGTAGLAAAGAKIQQATGSTKPANKTAGKAASENTATTKPRTTSGGIGKVSGISSPSKTSTGTNRSTHTGIIGRAAQQKAQNEGQAALSGLAGGLNQSWQNIAQANKTAQQRATGGGTLGNLAPVPETAIKSGQKLGGALLTGNLADAQFGQPTVSPGQAAQEAEERTAATQEALRTGNWQHFAPADGSGYAIVRPDDAQLLGTTEQQGFDPLAIVTQQEFGERQQRQAGAKTYDTPAIREEELRRADQQQSAVQKSLTAATGGAIQGALGMATVSPAQRTAKEIADEQWQGVVDRYIESTPYYQGEKARLDAESAQIDAALEATDAQIAEMDAAMQAQGYFTPGDLNAIDDARKQRRQLLMLKYENQRYQATLTDKARAVEIDEGRLEGNVSDTDRLKYGVSVQSYEGEDIFGKISATMEQARFAGNAALLQVADGIARDLIMIAADAQSADYDNAYEYMAGLDEDDPRMQVARAAYDPTLNMSLQEMDYGNDFLNAAQPALKLLADNGFRLALSWGSAFVPGLQVLGPIIINSSLAYGDAATEARKAGASQTEVITAGTITAAAQGTLEMIGFNKLENAAKSLLTKLTPGVRKLIPQGVSRLIQSGGAKAVINTLGNAIEEGNEESVEGTVGRLVRKTIYDDEMPWFGEGGVIDPGAMLSEFGGGAAFGGLFTLLGGLALDANTPSRTTAEDVVNRIMSNRPIEERMANLSAMLETDVRKAEIAPADVAAHEALWTARQQEVPQSLVAWQNAAQQAQSAQTAHTTARNALAQLMADAESGAVDLESKSGMQLYGTAMQRVRQAAGELARAAQLNVAMRDAYYADEDALVEGIEVKHAALEEIASTITTDITEATGGAATEYMLQSAEVQTAMRQVRAAMLAQMSARGDIDAAMEAMHLADGPDAMLEAEATTDAMQARADEADAAVEAAREELRRTVMTEADYAARMAEGRAANDEAGTHDAAYDHVSTTELRAERDREAAYMSAMRQTAEAQRGPARRAAQEAMRTAERHTAAIDAELALRESVYGTDGDIEPQGVQQGMPELQPLPTITLNGDPLLARMTDNELAEDIAYANRLANDPDPDIAAAGQSRRETLRQERAAREERMNAPTWMRQERLNEINAQLDAIAEQSDNDLGRQRRWLEGQQRRLDNLVQEVDGDEQRMYMRQLHEAETALEAVKSEQAARRDARRTAARDLMAETDEELREGGREPDDRERIQRNQEAGRKAVQRLNESRDRGLRITDTISIEDAASVFADTEGMADTGDATTADMLLRHNAAQLAMWEERRAQLQSAAGEMRMELRDLMQAQETPDADADPSEQVRILGRIESLRDGIERANALAKRADTEIRYYAAHGAEGVTESLQSGHIAEPLMERIMGIVDVMKGDGAGGLAGYHMNTPDRVFDDHFGQNAPVMRAIYIDPIKKAEAERTRYMQQVIADLKALKLNKEERALVQQYGERKISAQQLEAAITNKLAARGQRLKSGAGTHKGGETFEGVGDRADEMQRIAYAAETIHNWYVQMHGMVNEALEANGYEKIGEIKNYFPHFEGEEGNALKRAFRKLGLAAPDFSIPTDIAGMTETFSPGHKYSAHTQHRTGDKTTYDAIEGMDRYLDSMTQIAFHTGNIKRLRQLESAIRAGEKSGTLTGRGQGNEDFGHMAMWLHEYANQLAGKKANIMGDRQLENLLGRRAYGALDKLVKHKGAAAVALSISSTLSNSIPVAEVMTKHGIHLPRMLGRLIAGAKDSTKAMPQSDFLTRRFGTGELSETLLEALMNKASKLFELMDKLAAHIVVRTCYEANIAHGMDPESAIMSADAEAARLMADRSKGALPTIFGSRVFTATLGQFQIEPVNQFARLLKDTFRESGEVSGVKTTSKGMEQKAQLSSAAKVKGMASLALFAVMSNLVNQLWERLMGRDIQPDPIGIGEDMVHTYQETGDWYRTLAAGANGVMEQVPFFSGGRVGTNTFGEMVEDFQTVQKAIEATLSGSEDAAYLWDKIAWMPSYYATGGGQFRKIYQGIGKVMQDGVYNKNGQLMYPIDTTNGWVRAQAALFGYSSTEYARKYWDEGRSALNDDNTQKYLELVEDGMSPIDAYESLYAYQQAGSLYSKYAKAIKAGDTAGAQALRAEIAALTEQVDYAAVIPAVGRDELGKPYMAMLERAWRESGNKAFMPEYYYGEFTSKGVSYKFTPEAMATLQGVFERELADEMEQYSAAWPAMTAEERAEAYSDAKSEARKATKQYGFDNKLPYVTEQAYVEAGYTAPEDAPGAEMQPGLTNPIGDIYRMATGEPVDTAEGGFGEDMGKLFTGTGAVNSPETPQQLLETEQQIEAQTGNPGGGSSGGSGGSSRRRSSGGRSSGGSTEQQPGEAASYWQRQARAAFGEDYTPAPVDASIDMPDGSRRQLTGDDATIYERLYNAFMTVYMWSGLQGWNTADMQGRMALLADMMQRARAAAGDFWRRFYGSGMGRYTIEAENNE